MTVWISFGYSHLYLFAFKERRTECRLQMHKLRMCVRVFLQSIEMYEIENVHSLNRKNANALLALGMATRITYSCEFVWKSVQWSLITNRKRRISDCAWAVYAMELNAKKWNYKRKVDFSACRNKWWLMILFSDFWKLFDNQFSKSGRIRKRFVNYFSG